MSFFMAKMSANNKSATNMNTSTTANSCNCSKVTAKGNKNIVSTSNIKNIIA